MASESEFGWRLCPQSPQRALSAAGIWMNSFGPTLTWSGMALYLQEFLSLLCLFKEKTPNLNINPAPTSSLVIRGAAAPGSGSLLGSKALQTS